MDARGEVSLGQEGWKALLLLPEWVLGRKCKDPEGGGNGAKGMCIMVSLRADAVRVEGLAKEKEEC